MQLEAYRRSTFRADAADKTTNSIPVILATETPVKTWDKTHRKVVNEVLLMSGVVMTERVTSPTSPLAVVCMI